MKSLIMKNTPFAFFLSKKPSAVVQQQTKKTKKIQKIPILFLKNSSKCWHFLKHILLRHY